MVTLSAWLYAGVMSAIAACAVHGAYRGRWGAPGATFAFGQTAHYRMHVSAALTIVTMTLLQEGLWRDGPSWKSPGMTTAIILWMIAMAVYAAATVFDVGGNALAVRRGSRVAREVVAGDVETRIALDEPETLRIVLSPDKPIEGCGVIGAATVARLERALAPFRRNARIVLTIIVHPLPASATLRAAMAARGDDPMGGRSP